MKLVKSLPYSFILLLIILAIIYVLANINEWVGTVVLNASQIQALQFAIALIGIFLNAHYQSKNLERQFREERKKELRHQGLANLDDIKSWLVKVTKVVEDITILRELSNKDKQDGALIINSGEIKPVKEKLLRLEMSGFATCVKVLNTARQGLNTSFQELEDGTYKELLEKTMFIWLGLNNIRETLTTTDKIPDAEQYIHMEIAEAMKLVDQARYMEINRE